MHCDLCNGHCFKHNDPYNRSIETAIILYRDLIGCFLTGDSPNLILKVIYAWTKAETLTQLSRM